jgi:hypothetical protein
MKTQYSFELMVLSNCKPCQNILYNNLIPGIAAACCWGAESGKLKYPCIFRQVPAWVYMSVSKQQRSSICPLRTVGGKISDKKEQWINIKFCVMIGKSASETLALLTLAYGE